MLRWPIGTAGLASSMSASSNIPTKEDEARACVAGPNANQTSASTAATAASAGTLSLRAEARANGLSDRHADRAADGWGQRVAVPAPVGGLEPRVGARVRPGQSSR